MQSRSNKFNYCGGALNNANILQLYLHHFAAILLLVTGLHSHTFAQMFPSKPLRIIVPYTAGGPADVISRILAERLESYFQQRVLVENRTGGNATIGTDFVAKSASDGYTMLLGAPAHTANPSLMKSLPYDIEKDFTAVSMVMEQPMVIAVHHSIPVNSIAELVTLLKANPTKYNYGTSGAGGPQHLMGEIFKSATGTQIQHIPYRGASAAAAALVAGDTQISFGTPTNTMPFVKSGQLRALAVSTSKRSPFAPDLPTLNELGFTNFNYSSWAGIFVPAGTPKDIVNKLHDGLNKALREKETRDRIFVSGMQSAGSSSPEEFSQFIKMDIARTAKIIKETGIQPE
jgi:tripartite-type tricarboxylate transporter receptor subunit TctC